MVYKARRLLWGVVAIALLVFACEGSDNTDQPDSSDSGNEHATDGEAGEGDLSVESVAIDYIEGDEWNLFATLTNVGDAAVVVSACTYTATELQDGTELASGQLTGDDFQLAPDQTRELSKTVHFERAPTVRIDAEIRVSCDTSNEAESLQSNNEATSEFQW